MNRKTLFEFLFLGVIWGSSYSLIAVSLERFSPLQVAQVRLIGGAVVLLAVLLSNRARRGRVTWSASFVAHLFGAGLVSTALPYLLISWGETKAPSAVAGMLGATTPIFAAILAPMVLKEALGTNRKVGISVGLVGVVLIFHPWNTQGMGSIIAEGAIVLAAALYAVSFIYLKRFLIPTGASSLTIAAGQITASALMLLALDPTGPGVVLHGGARVDLSVLTLGIIQTGFAALLSTRLVRQVSATVSSAVTYLIAVVSVAEGFFFQHQKLELVFFAGALVVMVGLFITSSGDSMSFFESRAKGLKPSS